MWIGLSHYWLGLIYGKTGRLDKAEENLRKSLNIRIKKFPEGNQDIWQSRAELGICLVEKKKYDEAEPLLLSSLDFYKTDYERNQEMLERLFSYTIQLYNQTGEKSKAEKYLNQIDSLSK